MTAVSYTHLLDVRTLPANISGQQSPEILAGADRPEQPKDTVVPLKELERAEIQKALRICGNDTEGKKKAAKMLGIGLATLYRRMEAD